MTVHILDTADQFKETIAKNPVVILDAFAQWCGPCKAIAPQVAKWAQDPQFKDKTYFAKFDDGKKVDGFVGANPPALLNLLKKYNPEDGGEGGQREGREPQR
ncbi:hypothetical protein NEMBOFW57_006809 [Staphylotrichum longicolle]|uniref:Thioredoxin domain-containing protein n=1 Tax=Staphylotrichum longicolle TaxID=669026 RepID=A0AAD4EUA2_9PEZI|nr:hypothetical protein NEMBOFW57_006809 [Staphylotrichum longicolle]